MAVQKSILGITMGITMGLAALTGRPAAAAEAGQCSMVLTQADEARSSLEALTAALEQGTADRTAWIERTAEINSELAGLIGEKGPKVEQLRRERAEIDEDLRTLDKLHPVLTSQAEALSAIVDETERAYIACIEATI